MSPTPSPTDPGSGRRTSSGLSWTARRRLSLLVLVVGLPVYVVAAVTLVGLFERPPIWLEFLIYVGLGFLWVAPLRRVFLGVGQPDPAAEGTDRRAAGDAGDRGAPLR